MTFMERRKALAELSERDKRIYQLAWKCRNDLIFSQQNAGRSAEDKYARTADEAIRDLENVLLGISEQPDKEGT